MLPLTLPCSIDVTGWMSIGSLDGYLYSISPDGDIRKFVGKTAHDSVIHASPVLDCSGFSMYVAQTIMEAKSIRTIGDHTYVSAMKPSRILFTLLAPATGTIYWTGEYPGLFFYLYKSILQCGRHFLRLTIRLNIIWVSIVFPGGLSNLLSSSDLNDFMVDETILLTVLSAASKSLYNSGAVVN